MTDAPAIKNITAKNHPIRFEILDELESNIQGLLIMEGNLMPVASFVTPMQIIQGNKFSH
jgi:hypothetical protein